MKKENLNYVIHSIKSIASALFLHFNLRIQHLQRDERERELLSVVTDAPYAIDL